jgi:hypothetical protein
VIWIPIVLAAVVVPYLAVVGWGIASDRRRARENARYYATLSTAELVEKARGPLLLQRRDQPAARHLLERLEGSDHRNILDAWSPFCESMRAATSDSPADRDACASTAAALTDLHAMLAELARRGASGSR